MLTWVNRQPLIVQCALISVGLAVLTLVQVGLITGSLRGAVALAIAVLVAGTPLFYVLSRAFGVGRGRAQE